MRILILCILLAAGGAQAAPLAKDLGLGLAYYRAHALPEDLPPARGGKKGACILDLRFARGDGRGAAALAAWIHFNASVHAPVLVLANASTDAVLLRMLAGRASPGFIVIGPAAPHFAPDLAVPVTREADRRSYDAMEKGATIASLLEDNPGKPRVDEALLEREHLSDTDLPEEAASSKASTPPPPPSQVDAVLQRAVDLHRSLLALKRL